MRLTDDSRDRVEELAAFFSALADPTRLRLVKLLAHQRDPDALCVNALAELLGVSQSAVSQHLRILRATDLVKGERRGFHVHYFVNPKALRQCHNLIEVAFGPAGAPTKDSCGTRSCQDGMDNDRH